MDARYDPSAAERPIFDRWEAAGVFGGVPDPDREPFVIALPLPNVTGDLHMGHAVNGSYQDTLIRLRRMQGRDSLWICGTDHAGIAVHAVIDKQLRAEGLTRWDLGRERFLERVWRWREETGRHDHRPVQAARVLARLRPRAVHDGRGLRRRGAHDVRRALPQGLHPPRQPHDQLVPDVRLDDLRPRGALRARGRHAVRGALPDRRHRRLPDGRDRPARDDPGRHRRRRASRTTSATSTSSAAPRSCRSSTARCRSSPTST